MAASVCVSVRESFQSCGAWWVGAQPWTTQLRLKPNTQSTLLFSAVFRTQDWQRLRHWLKVINYMYYCCYFFKEDITVYIFKPKSQASLSVHSVKKINYSWVLVFQTSLSVRWRSWCLSVVVKLLASWLEACEFESWVHRWAPEQDL